MVREELMLLGLGVSSECVQRATATSRTNFAVLLRLSQEGYGCVIRAVSAQELGGHHL